jgi:hypothetical protein
MTGRMLKVPANQSDKGPKKMLTTPAIRRLKRNTRRIRRSRVIRPISGRPTNKGYFHRRRAK